MRRTNKDMETSLLRFNIHGGLSQSEENKCMCISTFIYQLNKTTEGNSYWKNEEISGHKEHKNIWKLIEIF